MKALRKTTAALAALVFLGAASEARADDDPPDPAFRYTTPPDRDYARAAVEQGIILFGGYVQYTLNTENQLDWDLSADWPSLRSKLVFDTLSFDNNRFPTNWLTHPLAGWAYYSAARGNRIPIPISFAMAFSSSFLWEYIGEIREHAAINDLIATPATGMVLGESMLQLGALMHRSRRTPLTSGVGLLFAPFKTAHDWLDGLESERATSFDDFGLANDVWHRIRIGAAAGVTRQEDGVTQGDGRLYGSSRIVALEGYGGEGQASRWFDSGEVTELHVSATTSEARLVDLLVFADLGAFGYHWQDVKRDRAGGLRGHGVLASFLVNAEYGTHDYDRDGRRENDRLSLVATGAAVEHRVYSGALATRLRLDVLGSFAGVDAYALPEYRRDFGDLRLTSVLRVNRYYHAYGATLRPRFDLELGRFDAGADLRFDAFEAITGVDVDVEPDPLGFEIQAQDRRTIGRGWVGFAPTKHLRLSVTAEGRERSGYVDTYHSSRSELSLYGGAEVIF